MFHNKQPTVKQKKRMLWPTIDSLINFMVNKIFVCEPKSEVKKESKKKKKICVVHESNTVQHTRSNRNTYMN